jgi:hypothetical protein
VDVREADRVELPQLSEWLAKVNKEDRAIWEALVTEETIIEKSGALII